MEIDISSHLYTTSFTVPVLIVASLLALAVFIFGVLLSIKVGMKKSSFLIAFVTLLGVMAGIAGTLFAGFAGADWLNHNAGNRENIRTSTVIDLFEEETLQEISLVTENPDELQLKIDPILNIQEEEVVHVILGDGQPGIITLGETTAVLTYIEEPGNF